MILPIFNMRLISDHVKNMCNVFFLEIQSHMWTTDFNQATQRRGGRETRSVSPKFAFGSLRKVAKSIPGNLVFLRFHGGLRICLNSLEKSHCEVCTNKELQGDKTGKLQIHKLHWRVCGFPLLILKATLPPDATSRQGLARNTEPRRQIPKRRPGQVPARLYEELVCQVR